LAIGRAAAALWPLACRSLGLQSPRGYASAIHHGRHADCQQDDCGRSKVSSKPAHRFEQPRHVNSHYSNGTTNTKLEQCRFAGQGERVRSLFLQFGRMVSMPIGLRGRNFG
jgi:hypothetical protein